VEEIGEALLTARGERNVVRLWERDKMTSGSSIFYKTPNKAGYVQLLSS
jgi:hypothetical protein